MSEVVSSLKVGIGFAIGWPSSDAYHKLIPSGSLTNSFFVPLKFIPPQSMGRIKCPVTTKHWSVRRFPLGSSTMKVRLGRSIMPFKRVIGCRPKRPGTFLPQPSKTWTSHSALQKSAIPIGVLHFQFTAALPDPIPDKLAEYEDHSASSISISSRYRSRKFCPQHDSGAPVSNINPYLLFVKVLNVSKRRVRYSSPNGSMPIKVSELFVEARYVWYWS